MRNLILDDIIKTCVRESHLALVAKPSQGGGFCSCKHGENHPTHRRHFTQD